MCVHVTVPYVLVVTMKPNESMESSRMRMTVRRPNCSPELQQQGGQRDLASNVSVNAVNVMEVIVTNVTVHGNMTSKRNKKYRNMMSVIVTYVKAPYHKRADVAKPYVPRSPEYAQLGACMTAPVIECKL